MKKYYLEQRYVENSIRDDIDKVGRGTLHTKEISFDCQKHHLHSFGGGENLGPFREPDKLRIFVNYALKTPEYECLSNFNRITYCCHFSAYARGFVLFRTNESRSGDAEFGR